MDEISQAERRRILAEERTAKTYLAEAQANTDLEPGGRFAKITKTTFVGAGPITYPTLPADNPSNQALLAGDEPPLGHDVNEMVPVGAPHEIKASEAKRRWRRI